MYHDMDTIDEDWNEFRHRLGLTLAFLSLRLTDMDTFEDWNEFIDRLRQTSALPWP